ncbi:hypothetical protein [Bartonella sp. A05]|nr:hypothetical protein [Bartonella sp. A05]MCZ2204274.1 hypothetical protein [Bartonella sp. A05]
MAFGAEVVNFSIATIASAVADYNEWIVSLSLCNDKTEQKK